MALRAEIAVMDDDENVVGIVKVPLFEQDVKRFERGPFAENMVTDPDTGEVYKFTFQADLVGQIAPKREEPGTPEVKAGDTVRIIASDNPYGHALKIGSIGRVRSVAYDGAANVDGVMENGRKLNQDVAPEDIVVVQESTFPKEGDFVRIIGNDNPTHHNFKMGGLAEVVDVDSFGTISATGVGLSGTTITQFVSRADYILE